MFDKNDSWLLSFMQKSVKKLLYKLPGVLLVVFAVSANAAGSPQVPEEMESAIRSAVQAHPEVMGADSKVFSAKSQVNAGEYRWYPRAEASVRTGERGDRYATVGLNQTLWDGGKINADFEAAKAGEQVAISGKNLTSQSIGLAAAIAYLDVAKAREQKQVAEENVKEHRKLHYSVLKRNDGGIGSRSDVTLTTSRLQQARAMEEYWVGAVARAEAAYFSVVGKSVAAGELPLLKSVSLDTEKENFLARVIERSPSLQKLRDEVKVAEATVDSKKAALFPMVYARVDNTKYFGSAPFDNDTRFSVNMQWQNDVALTQRFQVESAQYMVEAARHALEAEERILVQSANNYWADYMAAISRSAELDKFEESAVETVKQFKRQFTIGRRSWPEVTNTLQDLYSARSQKVEAKYAAMVSRMQMAFIGGEMDYLIMANASNADVE